MTERVITSVQNQRVKDAVKLRSARQRARQGRFLVDGARELLRAMGSDLRLLEVFVCKESCTSNDAQEVLRQAAHRAESVLRVSREVMDKLAFGHRSEGVLAVAETPRHRLDELVVSEGALVAVLEGVEKPGNVGAVLRSADGAGVAAVIVAEPGTDLYNPNCIRASLGTIFTLPVVAASTGDVVSWLGAKGFKVFAAALDGVLRYTKADYRGSTAIVLGSEATGLSTAWQAAGATSVKLPMHGAADSLNVSAAAAVLFYEALRQRELR